MSFTLPCGATQNCVVVCSSKTSWNATALGLQDATETQSSIMPELPHFSPIALHEATAQQCNAMASPAQQSEEKLQPFHSSPTVQSPSNPCPVVQSPSFPGSPSHLSSAVSPPIQFSKDTASPAILASLHSIAMLPCAALPQLTLVMFLIFLLTRYAYLGSF